MKSVIRTECLPKEQRVAIRRACQNEIKNHNRRMLKLQVNRLALVKYTMQKTAREEH